MTSHADASLRTLKRDTALLLTLSAAVVVSLAALGCEESRAPAKAPTGSDVSTTDTPSALESNETKATASATDASPTTPDGAAATPDAKPVQPAAAPAAEESATRNISFDRIKFDLKSNADYKPEMLTPDIKTLDGKNVRIRGFMFPSFKPTGLTEWVLVRDNMQCCFGGNAILYDCIIVDMKPGKSTDYTTRIVSVEGTFTIRDWFDLDGVRRAIYHLDGESVRF